MAKPKRPTQKQQVDEEKQPATRKRPYRACDLIALQEKVSRYAGRFQALAIQLEEEGIEVVSIDGGAMLDRAFDSIGLFLANADAGLTRAKAELRRVN